MRLSPIVTGATVVGLKYKDGVILAADTLASYGSEARYKDVSGPHLALSGLGSKVPAEEGWRVHPARPLRCMFSIIGEQI